MVFEVSILEIVIQARRKAGLYAIVVQQPSQDSFEGGLLEIGDTPILFNGVPQIAHEPQQHDVGFIVPE